MAFETGIAISIDSRGATQGGAVVKRELRELDRASDKTVRSMGGAFNKLRASLRGVGGAFNRLRRSIFSVRSAIIAFVSAVSGRELVGISANFEDLRTSLAALPGGAREAAEAFAFIQGIAREMPLSIEQLTQTFITLKASGIEPTRQLLMTFSDAASVTTDRVQAFDAMTRIFARGIQGGLGLEELNQIADRGLPVWDILEEKLGRNRLELGELGQDAEGARKILNALAAGIQERFGGATQSALTNLSTKISNFGDAFRTAMDNALRDSRTITDIKTAIDDLTAAMPVLQAGMTTAIQVISDSWSGLFEGITSGAKAAWSALTLDFDAMTKEWEKSTQGFMRVWDAQTGAFKLFQENLENAERGPQSVPRNVGDAPGRTGGVVPSITGSASKELKDFADILKEDVRTAQEIYLEQTEKIEQALRKKLITEEEARRATIRAKEAYVDANPVLREARDAFGDLADSMTRSFEEGRSAGEAFRDWFRSFISDLISQLNRYLLKQIEISQTPTPGGGGFSSLLGSLFSVGTSAFAGASGTAAVGSTIPTATLHTGGIVGSDGASRYVHPGVFSGAQKFHRGGLVPGEVPIIAKRGEEVLTPDNPRHRNNARGGAMIYIDARGSNGDAAVEAAVERGIQRATPVLIDASVQKVKGERARDPNFFGPSR